MEKIRKEQEKQEKNTGNISVHQEKSVSLHHVNENNKTYDRDAYRRAEADASEDDTTRRYERLGVRAYESQGRPTLACRWDTFVYEEGLQSEPADHLLGSARLAVREESERLISVARQVGDYIPSSVWDSFGMRNTKPSGESVVFIDRNNDRVVKFKDPFVYVSLKGDNPYNVLFEHHIHNHFFGNADYRLLGVSQDPVSGDARLAFEQPFIKTTVKPERDEIDKWFKKRGFELSKDGFWYTDGYVSFTDVEGDNCIKDTDGYLHFIDPIIKFDRSPKEVLSHYAEQVKAIDGKLAHAGIGLGSRFRVDMLNQLNDFEVKRIDYGGGRLFFGPLASNTHPDYQREFDWPIDRVLDNIKLSQGRRWVQIDEYRHDLIIPRARQAVIDRANDMSPGRAFTAGQRADLEHYTALFKESIPLASIYDGLVSSLSEKFKEDRTPVQWIAETREELHDLAKGIQKSQSEQLRI